MSNKNKTFQTYMLWLIDMACIIISYMIASWLRYDDYMMKNFWIKFDVLGSYGDKGMHYMICIIFLLFCVVYSFLADWNRDFVVRGYIKDSYRL